MKAPLTVTAVKGHDISTYRLDSGRCMVVWYDSDGNRQRRSRATLKEAETLVKKVADAMKERVAGSMTGLFTWRAEVPIGRKRLALDDGDRSRRVLDTAQ